jgi:hypothetical protein
LLGWADLEQLIEQRPIVHHRFAKILCRELTAAALIP